MSMTKKDYVAIADAINGVLWQKDTDPLTITVVSVALAEAFLKDNPQFQHNTFIQACYAERKETDNV
jgi:hypothetical protein